MDGERSATPKQRPDDVRQRALALLLVRDPHGKAAAVLELHATSVTVDPDEPIKEPCGVPGRPEQPRLVPHTQLGRRSPHSVQGRALLLHAIAHIEFNAINLALDAIWRFGRMPASYYFDWLEVAREEAKHFGLLSQRLRELGFEYGQFCAHNALWEMAHKTSDDVLARMALVPRVLEARGLDASPAIRDKLVAAGDLRAASIIDIILNDEIGHVAIGNHWFHWLCAQRGLEPLSTFSALARQHAAPRPRGPFNFEARRAAGFDEAELAALSASTP